LTASSGDYSGQRGSGYHQKHDAGVETGRGAQCADTFPIPPGRVGVLSLLGLRSFVLVWLGGLVSLAGDWVLIVGLPLVVYEMTHSTLATGTMFMAGTLPRLPLGSVAGVFVDRWDRRRTIVVTNILMGLGLLPLLAVRSAEDLWLVYVVQMGEACIAEFQRPALGALLPRLVDQDKLVAANALSSLGSESTRLVGPALGALVVAFFGLAGVVVVDAASFVVAGALVALVIGIPRSAHSVASSAAANLAQLCLGVWRDWRDGLRVVRSNRVLGVLFAFCAVTGVGEGMIMTLFVPFATTVVRGGQGAYGALLSAQAVGGLVGGLLLGRFGRGFAPRDLLGVTAVVFGVLDLLLFYAPLFVTGVGVPLALIMLVGVPAAGMGISRSTLLQTAATDQYRGRVLGAVSATVAVAGLAGMALAGLLGDRLGIVPLLTVQGVGYVVAGLMVLLVLPASAGARQTSASASAATSM